MPFVTIEDRVDRLEALFGQFLTEMAVLNKRADERHKAAEDQNKAAKESKFKDEIRAERKERQRQWIALSNKLGHIVEDVMEPNLPRLAREHFKMSSVDEINLRLSRRNPQKREQWNEFDAIVAGPEMVLLGEAKSSPSMEYANDFVAKLKVFFRYFPQYEGRKLIGVFGSWSVPPQVERRLTEQGIYCLQMGEDTMELTNAAALEAGGGKGKA